MKSGRLAAVPQQQNLVVFSVWLTQAVTLSRSVWCRVCGCMRDSTRDKPCPKWWLRSGNGLLRLHHCWIGKYERLFLEVLKTGHGVEERQRAWKRAAAIASVCVSSIKVQIRIHWTRNKGERKWFKSNYGSVLVGVRWLLSHPVQYMPTRVYWLMKIVDVPMLMKTVTQDSDVICTLQFTVK
jgi:hypothetical protein